MMRGIYVRHFGPRARHLFESHDLHVVAIGERGMVGALGFPFVVGGTGKDDLGNTHAVVVESCLRMNNLRA